jgi:hypothetical protein
MADPILAELEPEIVREWLNRPIGKRTEQDFFAFYGYLLMERAHLLKFQGSDKYALVKEILRKHI